MAAAQTEHEVPKSMLSIHYLRNNFTSHTGPFSAIAELIDNAYDPDVNAKQIWIDKTQIRDMECLTFRDDGNGLSRDLMHQMLSYGFSNKKALNGKLPIGMYGSGFQNGSMHLGKDVLILSKSKDDLCVGMLSQTYLEKTGSNVMLVPIISFKKQEENNGMRENQASLRDIREHSPFKTEEVLLTEFQAIEGPTGTKIIIWNLRRTSEGHRKLDFNTENDIRIPCDDSDTSDTSDTSVPERNSSLRAYCSILYLKPSMKINIRGQRVENCPIDESLESIDRSFNYQPRAVKRKIPITFGYTTQSIQHYGLMMYYKNRLIKAYHRVGCQLNDKNRRSIGVIGVIECNYLTPTPNKEDFVYDDTNRNTFLSLGNKLNVYSKKRRLNPSDIVPTQETDGERTQDNDQLQEVEQLEGEKASLSEECKQTKAQLTKLTAWRKGMEAQFNKAPEEEP
ncbi:unnamed protein product [Boreogadus saida]